MAFIAPSNRKHRFLLSIVMIIISSTLAVAAGRTAQECIGMLEGSGSYNSRPSPLGHQGKYQMGVAAMKDAGFCENNGSASQTGDQHQLWGNCVWTAKAKSYGVDSVEDFVNSPAAQEAAFAAYSEKTRQYATHYDPPGQPCCVNLYSYVGQTMADGTVITSATVDYIVHHGGTVNAYKYLSSNGKACIRDDAVNSDLCKSAKKMNDCMEGSTTGNPNPNGPGGPSGPSSLCA